MGLYDTTSFGLMDRPGQKYRRRQPVQPAGFRNLFDSTLSLYGYGTSRPATGYGAPPTKGGVDYGELPSPPVPSPPDPFGVRYLPVAFGPSVDDRKVKSLRLAQNRPSIGREPYGSDRLMVVGYSKKGLPIFNRARRPGEQANDASFAPTAYRYQDEVGGFHGNEIDQWNRRWYEEAKAAGGQVPLTPPRRGLPRIRGSANGELLFDTRSRQAQLADVRQNLGLPKDQLSRRRRVR